MTCDVKSCLAWKICIVQVVAIRLCKYSPYGGNYSRSQKKVSVLEVTFRSVLFCIAYAVYKNDNL